MMTDPPMIPGGATITPDVGSTMRDLPLIWTIATAWLQMAQETVSKDLTLNIRAIQRDLFGLQNFDRAVRANF